MPSSTIRASARRGVIAAAVEPSGEARSRRRFSASSAADSDLDGSRFTRAAYRITTTLVTAISTRKQTTRKRVPE